MNRPPDTAASDPSPTDPAPTDPLQIDPVRSDRTQQPASHHPADRSAPQEETIHLDQFLKLQGLADTGGQAKVMIQGGEVLVNGQVETRRRRQLRIGDIVEVDGEQIPVESDADDIDEAD